MVALPRAEALWAALAASTPPLGLVHTRINTANAATHTQQQLSENQQRQALEKIITSRGGLDPQRRGQFNEKALFSEDFYFKYGLRPTPEEVNQRPKDDLPFSPVQRRYSGYSKYSQRILSGLVAYQQLETIILKSDWDALLPALEPGTKSKGDANKAIPASEIRSFARVLGLFANTALQSENESTSLYNLLARHLINEFYFCLDDIASAARSDSKAEALTAWRAGREYLNAYLGLVNPTIIPTRVGDPFALL